LRGAPVASLRVNTRGQKNPCRPIIFASSRDGKNAEIQNAETLERETQKHLFSR
jgi:hypothetical protein